MKPSRISGVLLGLTAILTAHSSALASFHLVQIEQVIGGVNGDATVQAIQLRMRFGGQNFLGQARMRVFDASGQNPVLIRSLDFVPNGTAGSRVLIASANFAAHTNPAASVDFVMSNLIPESYLAAGSLTFESNFGTVWWRLSWGGENYTGPGTVVAGSFSVANDADGDANPPYPGPLPSSSAQALLFQGSTSAQGTNNADDYDLTVGAAVFTNNAGASFTVLSGPTGACCDDDTGTCTEGRTQADCEADGFRYGGDDSTCLTIDPACEPPPVGACCDDATFGCANDVTEDDCNAAGFRYGGDGSTCGTIDPPCEPVGACCDDKTGFCFEGESLVDCEAAGGRFGGDESNCATIEPPCEPPPSPPIAISLEPVAGAAAGGTAGAGTSLVSPVFATHPGDDSGRLFVVDQIGEIRIIKDGELLPVPFLDLSDRLVTLNPGFDERGLLGLAFHPDYAANGRFFVRYSAPREGTPADRCFYQTGPLGTCHSAVLAEFQVSDPAADVADVIFDQILLSIPEPEFNHNSGQVLFGPDGLLYLTIGDGGGANDDLNLNGMCDAGTCADESACSVSAQDCADLSDCISDRGFCSIPAGLCADGSDCLANPLAPPHGPVGNGQNPETLLGSILRIDVDAASAGATATDRTQVRAGSSPRLAGGGTPYGIPPGNPFADGVDGAPEIYAYGFRNPYRFSFFTNPDTLDSLLIVGDVGQNLVEEVDFVPVEPAPGLLNYGWAVREGGICFDPFNPTVPLDDCANTGPFGEAMIPPVLQYLQIIPCADDSTCAPFGVACDLGLGICENEGGRAVIGGFVYRGSAYPALSGRYVFGDFSRDFGPTGRIYYTDIAGPDAFVRREFFIAPDGAPLGKALLGIGEDEDGELYVLASSVIGPNPDVSGGVVLRVVPPAPAASGPAARYVEILPPPGPEPFALAVTAACPGAATRYVGAPSGSENLAVLEASPVFRTPAEWGPRVRVTGLEVVPEQDYLVQTDFGEAGSPAFSPAAPATTRLWGDVAGSFEDGQWTPPDGNVVIGDVLAQIDRFRGTSFAPPVHRADLLGFDEPRCLPDRTVVIGDVLAGIDAFRDVPFATTTGCADPCP